MDTADVHDEDILKSVTGLDVRMTVYNTYPQRAVMANCAKVTSRDHYSTNGVIHIVDKVMLPATKTLKEMIENDVQLASLKAVLEKSNLLEKLGEPGQYTLLAPSNEAFASLEPVSGLLKISTTFLHWQTHKALRISFASNLFFKPLGGGFFWPTCNGNSCLPPLENSMPCTAWVSLGGPI